MKGEARRTLPSTATDQQTIHRSIRQRQKEGSEEKRREAVSCLLSFFLSLSPSIPLSIIRQPNGTQMEGRKGKCGRHENGTCGLPEKLRKKKRDERNSGWHIDWQQEPWDTTWDTRWSTSTNKKRSLEGSKYSLGFLFCLEPSSLIFSSHHKKKENPHENILHSSFLFSFDWMETALELTLFLSLSSRVLFSSDKRRKRTQRRKERIKGDTNWGDGKTDHKFVGSRERQSLLSSLLSPFLLLRMTAIVIFSSLSSLILSSHFLSSHHFFRLFSTLFSFILLLFLVLSTFISLAFSFSSCSHQSVILFAFPVTYSFLSYTLVLSFIEFEWFLSPKSVCQIPVPSLYP